ncbi:MAG: hypothetical protein L6R41_008517 [Letrouitia leprolyta]|nr:MAG: hypothetical protein L6R41_008517 [Letrouitia leprolyta]
MAKSRPSRDGKSSQKQKRHLNRVLPGRPASKKSSKPTETVDEWLAKAIALVQTSQADEALPIALRALNHLEWEWGKYTVEALPALNLVAEINLELGDAETARDHFLKAAQLDPDGSIPESQGGGAEKFLWLAQLSEKGGHDSVSWFEKGIVALRNKVTPTTDPVANSQQWKKLAAALCGVVEIYMTDLSWETDAESRCEGLITEAMLLAPDSPEVLQTLANVRISQTRLDEARKALADSVDLWKDLPTGDEGVPEFPARISLSRLLMEVEMEDEALEVLERLIEEDDTSVEAWYLGGWCMYLIAEKKKLIPASAANESLANEKDLGSKATLISSRDWLRNSLRLYQVEDYEDERLRDHAQELVGDLDKELGELSDEEEEDGEDEDWESETDDDDEKMGDV